jgi:hypothetical protein
MRPRLQLRRIWGLLTGLFYLRKAHSGAWRPRSSPVLFAQSLLRSAPMPQSMGESMTPSMAQSMTLGRSLRSLGS